MGHDGVPAGHKVEGTAEWLYWHVPWFRSMTDRYDLAHQGFTWAQVVESLQRHDDQAGVRKAADARSRR